MKEYVDVDKLVVKPIEKNILNYYIQNKVQ